MRPSCVAALALCLLAMTGCDEQTINGPSVPFGARVVLAPNDVVAVADSGTTLRFVGVNGDSRCPADAICVHGGDAIVHLRVVDGGSARSYELHTGDASRAAVDHRGMRIALIDLQPYPFSSRPIEPRDYRAAIQVTQ